MRLRLAALAALALASLACAAETRYLAFQMFTDRSALFGGPPTPGAPTIAARADIAAWVQGVKDRIGGTGAGERRLAFVVGPLVLDYSDDALRQLVSDAFFVALDKDVAVALHIDDSMFWDKRAAIAATAGNVEWLDWNGTPNTGRRIDWSIEPTRIAPQLCYESPTVRAEVARVGRDVIGTAVREGIEMLGRHGKADLFAGVIVGWESQLGRDFDTDRALGFCALSYRGYSAAHPPSDLDGERVAVVRAYVDLWTAALASAGIDPARLYGHLAFTTRADYDALPTPRRFASYDEATNFSPPEAAFASAHRPGFSTYPATDIYPELYAQLAAHGNPPWASSEGTNVVPPGFRGEATMETYLARMFNHGATLVNLFGWGIGGDAGTDNPFRVETESDASIVAYRKFLQGGDLSEGPIPAQYGLAAKVAQVHARLAAYVAAGGNPKWMKPFLDQLARDLAANDPFAADAIADVILAMIARLMPVGP